MNILSPPKARIAIEVVYDLICPWCYLGVRRLLRTLHQRPDLLYDITWRPFLLNPDMPRAGMARPDYIIRKFGEEKRAQRLYASIFEIGRVEGIMFRFDSIRRTPNSVDAHRLVRFAARFGRADAVVEALFSAHFTEGRDVGDIALLGEIADAVGLDAHAAQWYLSSEADIDTVHVDNLRAHRLGINGVPCFILNDHHAIAGAQESEVIERLLDVAAIDFDA